MAGVEDDLVGGQGGRRLDDEDVDEGQVERDFQEEFADFDAFGARAKNVDVDLLRRALLNEKGAPELLHYEALLVKHLKEAVDRQQEVVDELQTNVSNMMRSMMYQMELDRVNYLIVEYLRTRLRKIERHAFFIIKHEEMRDRLSEAELRFAQRFADLQASHLRKLALSKMPEVHQKLDDQNNQVNMSTLIFPEPDLDSFVICQVLDDIGDIELEENNIVSMNAGELVAIRYWPIRDFVRQGSVALV
ncbi:DNA replication complex GINS protein SLD5 [Hondaea fermentalgiana]|uniref:DNA replication complex GINS protein SLD5 n=1 Tax=Hondaea fermentalgiana TaxID=2315210 RepID=A0A2R5GLF7_9STRA|nr:DNA replication complex GINS protein SLD5 [Hondaea fermentalgiana]|eukprot:GBG31710.1 DNA replication complex GINS protein SLD5 [Hondaea fermentalgiana]